MSGTDDRLGHLERELQRLAAEHARLEAELVRVRTANLELAGRMHAREEGASTHRVAEAPKRISRSQFLRAGGVAAAGAVAAGATGLLSAAPAAAATGDPLLIGQTNDPTTANDKTTLENPSLVQLSPAIFHAYNFTDVGIALPAARIAAAGTTSGTDTTSQPKVGLWGQTDSSFQLAAGVAGQGGAGGGVNLLGSLRGTTGVAGAAVDGGTGVFGQADGFAGFGVYGVSSTGYGVIGDSTAGVSLRAIGGGRLQQQLRATPGAPSTGSFFSGEQIRDVNGELWLCMVGGSPGTWRRAATVKEGFKGGSVNMLAKPIRLYDSRTGGGPPLAPGTTRDVQVTGVVVSGVSVPAGAVALLGNVAVTATAAPRGYLTLYPTGSPPAPATANINWFGAGQDLNTSVVVGLNPTTGKLTIHNGIAGGSAPTHVIVDAAAFVI